MFQLCCPPQTPLNALAEFAAKHPVRGFPVEIAREVLLHLVPGPEALLEIRDAQGCLALAAVLPLHVRSEGTALLELLLLGARDGLPEPARTALLRRAEEIARSLRARAQADAAPAPRAELDIALLPGREAWRPLLEQRGYRTAYTHCEMERPAGPSEPAAAGAARSASLELRPLQLAQAAAYQRVVALAFAGVPGSFVPEAAQIERRLLAGETTPQVLERDGQLLAFLRVSVREAEGVRIGAIELLGRAPALRGRGLGDALLQHAIESLRERGATRLELEVTAENAPALALYRRHGFEVARSWTIVRKTLEAGAAE